MLYVCVLKAVFPNRGSCAPRCIAKGSARDDITNK